MTTAELFDTDREEATSFDRAGWIDSLVSMEDRMSQMQKRVEHLERRFENAARTTRRVPFPETRIGRRIEATLYFLIGVGLVVACVLAVYTAQKNGILDL